MHVSYLVFQCRCSQSRNQRYELLSKKTIRYHNSNNFNNRCQWVLKQRSICLKKTCVPVRVLISDWTIHMRWLITFQCYSNVYGVCSLVNLGTEFGHHLQKPKDRRTSTNIVRINAVLITWDMSFFICSFISKAVTFVLFQIVNVIIMLWKCVLFQYLVLYFVGFRMIICVFSLSLSTPLLPLKISF